MSPQDPTPQDAVPAQPPLFLYHPGRQSQKLAIGTACAVAVVLVTSAIVSFPANNAMKAAGASWSDTTVGLVYGNLFFPFALAFLIAYATNCRWLALVRQNAEVLNPTHRHRYVDQWVWISWWVPVLSFWFPYGVVDDVRSATRRSNAGRMLLAQWWAAWLLFLVPLNVALVLPAEASAEWDTPLMVLSASFCVAALMAWIRIIHAIANDQAQAAAGQGWVASPAPDPAAITDTVSGS